jgi:hypothetical protein
MIFQSENYTLITPNFQRKSTVSKEHYVPLNNMVDYTKYNFIENACMCLMRNKKNQDKNEQINISYDKC